MIPGARGCTPQTCSFRDHFAELQGLGVDHLFGLSTQDSEYQREAAERLHLPFTLLSDEQLTLTRAMQLPTFETSGMTLLKRFTLAIHDGTVEHVFYPVFPPDRSVREVIRWLAHRTKSVASDASPLRLLNIRLRNGDRAPGKRPAMRRLSSHQDRHLRLRRPWSGSCY